MRNVIRFDEIEFWVDQNIIYCDFNADFLKSYQKVDVEEIFYNGISILSNGKYMPILINLEDISSANSVKIFKFLSNSIIVKEIVLSKIFLVRSVGVKVALSLYNLVGDPVVPIKICNDFNVAVKYCHKDYSAFNTIS
jgi:hypothetical protein